MSARPTIGTRAAGFVSTRWRRTLRPAIRGTEARRLSVSCQMSGFLHQSVQFSLLPSPSTFFIKITAAGQNAAWMAKRSRSFADALDLLRGYMPCRRAPLDSAIPGNENCSQSARSRYGDEETNPALRFERACFAEEGKNTERITWSKLIKSPVERLLQPRP